MADLRNKYIYQSYPSVVSIGTSGTSGVSATPQALTDGIGVELPITVSLTTIEVKDLTSNNLSILGYGEVIDNTGTWVGEGAAGTTGTSGTSGTSGATGSSGQSGTSGTSGADGTSGTSGLTGAASALILGAGVNSLASALTATPASSPGDMSIAIGNDARTTVDRSAGIAIGWRSRANADETTAVGADTTGGDRTVAIGTSAYAVCCRAIAIGMNATSTNAHAICIGNLSTSSGESSIAIGGPSLVASAANAIAIGAGSIANAAGAISLGHGLTASTVNTLTIKKLQMMNYAEFSFADDAAAAAGGIPLGGVYHTSGALKIRIA